MELRLGFLFCSHKGAVAVRQPYIRVVGMEETNEASSRGPATFTQEEVLTELDEEIEPILVLFFLL